MQTSPVLWPTVLSLSVNLKPADLSPPHLSSSVGKKNRLGWRGLASSPTYHSQTLQNRSSCAVEDGGAQTSDLPGHAIRCQAVL
jgi:hypothetical protein